MSKFQHTFTVRQHTPMIHFQADQEGAFLRVSELKPAFDRFLWEKIFKNDFENNYTKLVGYVCREDKSDNKHELQNQFNEDFRALDYSVEIDIPNTESWSVKDGNDSFPCFFGDMGDNFDPLKLRLIFSKQDFEIKVTCFNPELLDILIKNFASFLCAKNFGVRQSKGFGSFTVIEDGEIILDYIKNSTGWYSYKLKNVRQEDFKGLFNTIQIFWKCLRGGITIWDGKKSHKIASALSLYIKDNRENNNLLMEQSVLKKIVDSTVDNTFNLEKLKVDINKTRIYRDVLGFASETTWLSQDRSLKKTISEIDRMKSPIQFKPICFENSITVYIFCSTADSYKHIMLDYANETSGRVKTEVMKGDKIIRTDNLKMVEGGTFYIRKFMDYVSDENGYKTDLAIDFNKLPNSLINTIQSLTKLSTNS